MNPRQSFLQRIMGTQPKQDNSQSANDYQVKNILSSLATNETGGLRGDTYNTSQYSGKKDIGNAIGKYRVTDAELKSYAPRYLGQSITGPQFQASSTAQENYMKGKVNNLLNQGYTPQQVADIHNKGITNTGNPGSTTYQNPDYVNKFNANYQKGMMTPNPSTVTPVL